MSKSYRRDLAQLCAEYGWRVKRVTGSGHLQLAHPAVRQLVIAANSASDHRTLRNLRALLKRLTPGAQ